VKQLLKNKMSAKDYFLNCRIKFFIIIILLENLKANELTRSEGDGNNGQNNNQLRRSHFKYGSECCILFNCSWFGLEVKNDNK